MRVLDLWLLTGQDIDIPVENLTCTCHFLFPEVPGGHDDYDRHDYQRHQNRQDHQGHRMEVP